MGFEYVADTATSDLAFRAWGRDLAEVMTSAGDAVINAMVEDLATVKPRQQRPLDLQAEAPDLLLLELLQELIFYKDAEQLLLRIEDLHVEQGPEGYRLRGTACGEPFNPGRHALGVDVKAVTLHQLRVETTADGWEAFVIVDV